MPNWCSNFLEMIGPPEDIETFVAIVCNEEESGVLSTFYPPPPGKDAYDWCVANWGTKWDIGTPFTVRTCADRPSPDVFTVIFDSAWAPPEEAICMLSRLCPRLRFRLCYEESGCDFAGMCEYQAGELLTKDEGPAMPLQVRARAGNSDNADEDEWVDNPDYIGIEERWEDCYFDKPLTMTDEELAEVDRLLEEELPAAKIARLCGHCHQLEAGHANGQCLFGSTKYSPASTGGPVVRVIRWTGTPENTATEDRWEDTKRRIQAMVTSKKIKPVKEKAAKKNAAKKKTTKKAKVRV